MTAGRVICNARIGGRDADQQRENPCGICIGTQVHRHLDPALAVRQGPIGNLARNQISVGHDDFGGVCRTQHRRADANVRDHAGRIAHLNDIAHLDRTFKQQDQTRDEIVHDVLHAKTKPDTECASQDRELRQVITQQ